MQNIKTRPIFQGLNPLLSVCDQVNTNSNTVNLLVNPGKPAKNDGQFLVYSVNGRRMIHCYDPSHLIKTVRNNLETKDLIHKIANRWCQGFTNIAGFSQTASWEHISELYRMDKQSTQRLLPKLSDEHLAPNKLKMKVSLATQIFSNTCGSVMMNCIEEKKLPKHFDGTAQVLLFMNDIFDSINGSKKYKGDTLKSAVQTGSIHFSFWEYAVSVLSEMSFINKSDGSANNRSSVLKKLESTIRGYVEFTKTCLRLDIPQIEIRLHFYFYFIQKSIKINEFLQHKNFNLQRYQPGRFGKFFRLCQVLQSDEQTNTQRISYKLCYDDCKQHYWYEFSAFKLRTR